MSSVGGLELQRLYHAALEQPPGERNSFVERACAHDEGLRRELQSLLAHDHPGESLIDTLAIDVAARELAADGTEPAAVEPGSMIGAYKILGQIARGGMGVVYRAEQQHPVHRVVALKIIKPGMDSEQVIARFEAERQALALMDHPNIARVFDAGKSLAGRLYFVMEMVDGLPVTEYCQKDDVSLRDRLVLFISICQAIQHAHQKGIIHRDIKPSNILVKANAGGRTLMAALPSLVSVAR
jgi:serine/threonine protein kinase